MGLFSIACCFITHALYFSQKNVVECNVMEFRCWTAESYSERLQLTFWELNGKIAKKITHKFARKQLHYSVSGYISKNIDFFSRNYIFMFGSWVRVIIKEQPQLAVRVVIKLQAYMLLPRRTYHRQKPYDFSPHIITSYRHLFSTFNRPKMLWEGHTWMWGLFLQDFVESRLIHEAMMVYIWAALSLLVSVLLLLEFWRRKGYYIKVVRARLCMRCVLYAENSQKGERNKNKTNPNLSHLLLLLSP